MWPIVCAKITSMMRKSNNALENRCGSWKWKTRSTTAFRTFPRRMRRRVSIAACLVSRPPVVLYDSPTAGLDPVTSQTIITLIMRLRDTQGVTSMLATHRLQDAFGLANYRFDGQTAASCRPRTPGTFQS